MCGRSVISGYPVGVAVSCCNDCKIIVAYIASQNNSTAGKVHTDLTSDCNKFVRDVAIFIELERTYKL